MVLDILENLLVFLKDVVINRWQTATIFYQSWYQGDNRDFQILSQIVVLFWRGIKVRNTQIRNVCFEEEKNLRKFGVNFATGGVKVNSTPDYNLFFVPAWGEYNIADLT